MAWNKLVKYLSLALFVTGLTACGTTTPTYQPADYGKQLREIYAHDKKPKSNNLWDHMRQDFTLPDYSRNYRVQMQIRWYQEHKDYFERTAKRSAPYMHYIFNQVKKRGLPAELTLLPVIESAYNPFAYSHAGASGLWQMMPRTGRNFGLKQNYWYDGRRDVVHSTRAALDYLTYLRGFFNNHWLLAIAAYDSGEGTVMRAVRANSRYANRSPAFWNLALPYETQAYVPRLLAVVEIVKNPDRYGITLPPIQDKPYLRVVTIPHAMNIKTIAKMARLSTNEVYKLNPGHNRWAIGPYGPYRVVLPAENVQTFKRGLAHYKENYLKKHVVHKGETLKRIAKKYKTSTRRIKKTNKLKKNTLLAGQTLYIPPKLNRSTHFLKKHLAHAKKVISPEYKPTKSTQKHTLKHKVKQLAKRIAKTHHKKKVKHAAHKRTRHHTTHVSTAHKTKHKATT